MHFCFVCVFLRQTPLFEFFAPPFIYPMKYECCPFCLFRLLFLQLCCWTWRCRTRRAKQIRRVATMLLAGSTPLVAAPWLCEPRLIVLLLCVLFVVCALASSGGIGVMGHVPIAVRRLPFVSCFFVLSNALAWVQRCIAGSYGLNQCAFSKVSLQLIASGCKLHIYSANRT